MTESAMPLWLEWWGHNIILPLALAVVTCVLLALLGFFVGVVYGVYDRFRRDYRGR